MNNPTITTLCLRCDRPFKAVTAKGRPAKVPQLCDPCAIAAHKEGFDEHVSDGGA